MEENKNGNRHAEKQLCPDADGKAAVDALILCIAILAICRGMQMLSAVSGAEMTQDMPPVAAFI